MAPPRQLRPWSVLLLALVLPPTSLLRAQVSGSLDACQDGDIPWEDVRNAIFAHVSGRPVGADGIGRLSELALQGGLDMSQPQDCMYGWFTLRFFSPLILDRGQALEVLEQQTYHLEWALWLGSPWMEMIDSPWDVNSVLALVFASDALPKPDLQEVGCRGRDVRLLDLIEAEGIAAGATPSAVLAALAAQELLALPEDVLYRFPNSGDATAGWEGVCPMHAAASAAMLLGFAPSGYRITKGHALRVAQSSLKASTNFGFASFLQSPFPLGQLLQRLTLHIRASKSRASELAEDELAAQVVEASMAEFPAVHPSFLPPASRAERLRLFQGLGATHAMLTAAKIPYLAITGTLLGAMRHHGFIPWDGDADVCVDIRDETRLLKIALLQGSREAGLDEDGGDWGHLGKAAAGLSAAGFELFAHAERPLTYKLSGRSWPRVPGKPYGYPYIDLWFCHGWGGGRFSMQSAGYGVPMPRELIFPRRKVFFAGLPLWSFNDPRESLTKYYNPEAKEDWLGLCVGHATYHRQERKYNEEDEAERQNGRVPCSHLAELFAFASSPEPGLPQGVSSDALLRHIAAWLRLRPEPRWELDMDGSPAEDSEEPHFTEGWRLARDQVAEPLRLAGGSLRPRSLASPSTSFLKDKRDAIVHHLTEAVLELGQPAGARCDVILRMRPLDVERMDTQIVGAFAAPSAASALGEQLIERDEGGWLILDVPSCVCRHQLGDLRVVWVAEDEH